MTTSIGDHIDTKTPLTVGEEYDVATDAPASYFRPFPKMLDKSVTNLKKGLTSAPIDLPAFAVA